MDGHIYCIYFQYIPNSHTSLGFLVSKYLQCRLQGVEGRDSSIRVSVGFWNRPEPQQHRSSKKINFSTTKSCFSDAISPEEIFRLTRFQRLRIRPNYVQLGVIRKSFVDIFQRLTLNRPTAIVQICCFFALRLSF